MWVEIICGLIIYQLFRRFFYDDDVLDVETTDSDYLFSVAARLEKLYGGKAYIGLRIPDADSGSRQTIDMVLVTKGEAVVISIQNLSGFVSIDGDGSWVSAGRSSHKTDRRPDPVAEVKRQVAILESYLEQRGAPLPEGYLSCRVICPNPNFRAIVLFLVFKLHMWNELSAFDSIYNVNMNVIASPWHCHTSWTVAPIVPYQNVGICQIKLMQDLCTSNIPCQFGPSSSPITFLYSNPIASSGNWSLSKWTLMGKHFIKPFHPCSTMYADHFPPEVHTYDRWLQLKPEPKSLFSGWIKGSFGGGKKEMQESMHQNLNFIIATAPTWDRLELKGDKYVLGEFLEFKGKHDDIQSLKNIRRSKINRLVIQKTSMFGLAHSKLQVLYSPRDYRNDGASASEWNEATVRSSTEVVFQLQESTKVRKFKLSSVSSMFLSA
ncbi:hypothetical protein RHGRI_008839 [Rhododendron griersonianum]|uniref:NERD domain-containing protein n=1 Tax=Rhododendron griersonianum TaxID=479676 RepID=A0AAV6L2R2_9ERIC|nr:hypothetical protein RHGRI_008839 [Rhododendron griersonianum]